MPDSDAQHGRIAAFQRAAMARISQSANVSIRLKLVDELRILTK
jgi:hypothetical protein